MKGMRGDGRHQLRSGKRLAVALYMQVASLPLQPDIYPSWEGSLCFEVVAATI